MALKFVTPNGGECHGPPYTKAEEAAFYRAWNRPMTVLKDKNVTKAPVKDGPQGK